MATTTTMLIAGVLAGATLLAAACGDDDPASDDTTATTRRGATRRPRTAATTTTTTPAAAAHRLAVGHGDGDAVRHRRRRTGDRRRQTSPTTRPRPRPSSTDLSAFEPNVEAIAGYEPDLVVTPGPPGLTEQLEALDIEVWEGPAATTFGDAYAQIEQLGAITGHVGEAAEVVADMQADIEEIAQSVPTSRGAADLLPRARRHAVQRHSSTFIGEVYSCSDCRTSPTRSRATRRLPAAERRVRSSRQDPDLIFLADSKCCGESLETVAARDGWADMTAVVDGNVFAMDDDIASRSGPAGRSTTPRSSPTRSSRRSRAGGRWLTAAP